MATSPQLDDNVIQHICDNITNGNLMDAVNEIMNDGDVRADSVKRALLVLEEMTFREMKSTTEVTQLMISLIERWETL